VAALNKEERRAIMPESTKFIDEMREAFGDLVGIEAEENGQSVKWGEDWKDTVEFEANK
jgi:hypothetical protein